MSRRRRLLAGVGAGHPATINLEGKQITVNNKEEAKTEEVGLTRCATATIHVPHNLSSGSGADGTRRPPTEYVLLETACTKKDDRHHPDQREAAQSQSQQTAQ